MFQPDPTCLTSLVDHALELNERNDLQLVSKARELVKLDNLKIPMSVLKAKVVKYLTTNGNKLPQEDEFNALLDGIEFPPMSRDEELQIGAALAVIFSDTIVEIEAMSYKQNNQELNELQSVPKNEGHCIIRVTVNKGVHGNGVTYVCDYSFDQGINNTTEITAAKVYTAKQAAHIIMNESGRSTMARVGAVMDTVPVTYGVIEEPRKDTRGDTLKLWLEVPVFDLEGFAQAMGNPHSVFEAKCNAILDEAYQMYVTTSTTVPNTQLCVTVTYPGHASISDVAAMENAGLYGFTRILQYDHVGEGASAFTMLRFTL